jgi:hypothetical protein
MSAVVECFQTKISTPALYKGYMPKVLRTVLEADLCAGIKAETALESNHIPVQYSLDDDLKVQLFQVQATCLLLLRFRRGELLR